MENKEYKICSNCIMDTSDSSISFDSDGICDHCNNFYSNVEPTWKRSFRGEREESLFNIARKIKQDGSNQEYDCIIGISGGPDSSFMLHYVVTNLKLRPLVFHVDGGWNTKSAVNNIKNLVTKLNLDLKVKVVDWEEMRDLQLAYFKSGMSNLDTPQDQAFLATLYNYAEKHNIKYILNGGNISTENVVVPLEWMYYTTDMWLLKDVVRKFMSGSLRRFETSSAINHKFRLRYLKGIKVIKPLDYIKYIKEDALQLLESKYNYERFKNKHYESIFTKFYEGYWLPKRFGVDCRRVTLSSMVVTNQISRDNALKIVKNPALDEKESRLLFDYVSKKLRISPNELDSYMKIPKMSFKNYKNQYQIYKFGGMVLKFLKEDLSGKKR